MKHFDLSPEHGWDKFSRNSDLADLIYCTGIDRINQSGWFYINPMAGAGIFEDEVGNYLYLETQDIKDKNVIISMHCGLNDDKHSTMHGFIDMLINNYDLVRSQRSDKRLNNHQTCGETQ